MALSQLQLDNTLPREDSFNTVNTSGIVRYITLADIRNLDAMDRVCGDLVKRDIIIAEKINEIISVVVSNPNVDKTPFVLTDGTHPFIAPVLGVEGTLDAHLTTRANVRQNGEAVQAAMAAVTDQLSGRLTLVEGALPRLVKSDWTEYVWQAGTRNLLELELESAVQNSDRVIAITIMEKLDVARPTEVNPNPPAIWKYREATAGATKGAFLDDVWLQDTTHVNVLVPNLSAYGSGYPVEADYNLSSPRQRFYRAVVWEYLNDAPPVVSLSGDVLYLNMEYSTAAVLNKVFGGWKPNRDAAILGAQISLGTTATGSDLHIQFCDVTGQLIAGTQCVVTAGATFEETVFATPYLLTRGTALRAKITQIGSIDTGSDISVNIIYQPTA